MTIIKDTNARICPVRLVFVFCLWLMSTVAVSDQSAVVHSEKASFQVTELVTGLEHPWGLGFLPDGSMLITERGGRLRRFKEGRLDPEPIEGLPPVWAHGQGGLLDIVVDPQFILNRRIYLSYVQGRLLQKVTTVVVRARLDAATLTKIDVIFKAQPMAYGTRHFGSRLLFAPDGSLLITLGDRGKREWAQDPGLDPGSIIRILSSGELPSDNPFIQSGPKRAAVFAYGNRNPQGLALHPGSGEIWMHEHGPSGGDELNRLQAGTNYGWPIISYGQEYFSSVPVGEGTHKPGLAQPFHYWVPSIAPSGMTFYSGKDFPAWKDSLFIGSLKFGLLVRLELGADRVLHEERLLADQYGRIRDVRQGPDGRLYLLTDEQDGKLLRIDPL